MVSVESNAINKKGLILSWQDVKQQLNMAGGAGITLFRAQIIVTLNHMEQHKRLSISVL